MKKFILSLLFAVLATAGLYAQQISVVSSGGETSLYRTLEEAIKGTDPGSVIYLPGGGFTISDDVKITKKLTIIGIGYKSNNDNVDGVTTISGNIFFNAGSDGSAVIGCYITGNVNIGDDGGVNDVLIRCCNIKSVQVKNNLCQETTISQNYIRSASAFGESSANISNNIIQSIVYVNGGHINNNIVIRYYCTVQSPTNANYDVYRIIEASNSFISNNIMIGEGVPYYGSTAHVGGSNNQVFENMAGKSVGDSTIIVANWNDVFVNYNNGAVSPASNFHFKEAYSQYEGKVGVYADGVDFDKQLAPVPYIVAKRVDTETDPSGKLNVKIRVKAGQ